jgi:vacuolar-type H+-ATPase subunit H
MADSLRDWGFDVEAFRRRAQASVDDARGDLSEITGILRQTMAQTKQALLDLQKSREPVTTELKSGFERAWNEIENAFAKARQRVREAKTDKETVTTSAEHIDDSYWLG